MFHLTIIRPDGRTIEQQITHDRALVGRDDKCDLRLVDTKVSRNHCVLTQEGARVLVKDLESRNGTWLNGRRIRNKRYMKHGDVIQIGPFRLVFRPKSSSADMDRILSTTVEMPKHPMETYVHKDETEKVLKPLGMITNYLAETTGKQVEASANIRRERLNRNLVTLYRMTEELVLTRDLDEILDYIMDQVFRIFMPSQAIILLRENGGVPLPRKERRAEGQGNIRSVSNTIVRRILKDKVGILTDNALEDPRFESGDSVVIDGIRSVMAAPIWEDRSILGVIYVDSLDVAAGYQTEDLDLLTAIGHQTALAIQRWKLTEQLREGAVKNAVIRQNLGRFHSPQVVDLILKGAAELEPKESLATIFFCDIVGFTAMCEKLPPSELQAVLNLFLKTVNEVVFEEQGTLDKFIGDSAMAIFGAPVPQEDAAGRAIRSALKIRERLARAQAATDPDLRFQVRYGINTGKAVVGSFGTSDRMDYTILGLCVNLAFRICRYADPDRVVIGHETYEHVKDKKLFITRPVGATRLRGARGRVKLHEVVDFI